jgi:hypothetical protein
MPGRAGATPGAADGGDGGDGIVPVDGPAVIPAGLEAPEMPAGLAEEPGSGEASPVCALPIALAPDVPAAAACWIAPSRAPPVAPPAGDRLLAFSSIASPLTIVAASAAHCARW